MPALHSEVVQVVRVRAKAAFIEAQHNLTAARRQVVQETRQALAAFVSSEANLNRVRDELVPVLVRAEAQFRGGGRTLPAYSWLSRNCGPGDCGWWNFNTETRRLSSV